MRDNLNLSEKSYLTKPKRPCEATNYILYYFAANAQDAEGKTCDYVLDRSEMWNSTQVPGCKAAYDFVGMPRNRLSMRTLPCVCAYCCADRYGQCANVGIVGNFDEHSVSLVEVDCPEFLQLPLEGNRTYSINVLKIFLRRHNVRIPSDVTRRNDVIQLVMQSLGQFLLPANNAEA